MLLLAIGLLGIWGITPTGYLVSLSFVIGSSVSILVREAIAPSLDASHSGNGSAIADCQHLALLT